MMTPKAGKLIPWCTGISVALICLAIVFPVLLFKFYPYGIICTVLYVAVTALCTLLHFKSRTKITKLISFVLYSIPVFTLIAVLISIQIGWIPYP